MLFALLRLWALTEAQIGRALAIFNVDEVVVFDDSAADVRRTDTHDPASFLALVLQYLDCPQYLRKSFFSIQRSLRCVGLLNPIDAPHHMRMDDISEFREGVVLARPVQKGKGSFVNAGMRKEVCMYVCCVV